MIVERATVDHVPAIQSLFVRADIPCFCQYWQFEGDGKEWQNRCANDRKENADSLLTDLTTGRLEALVAREDEMIVGWVRISDPDKMKKLYQGRLYRNLPCFEEERRDVRTMSCFLVDPSRRRTQVARTLLAAAIQRARLLGASCLEAFPRGASDVSDEEQWMGPLAIYEDAGFELIHDFAPYPVYRLDLTS